MTKLELLKGIVKKAEGVSQKDVDAVLVALGEVIEDAVKNGDKVTIPKIGVFSVKEVSERRGTIYLGNRKGEEYVVPQHKEPKFTMNKKLKKILV